MKHEPSPAIHTESSLDGPIRVSGDLQGRPNSVSRVDGVLDMATACSVGGGFRKGTVASVRLDARHFILSQYATGAF